VQVAARTRALQTQIINASTSREIDAAFAIFERERRDARFVCSGPLFTSRRAQLALLREGHLAICISPLAQPIDGSRSACTEGSSNRPWRIPS
jgi:hypothetical protein